MKQLEALRAAHKDLSSRKDSISMERDAMLNEKNGQIEELTGVLKRQTEHLRRCRYEIEGKWREGSQTARSEPRESRHTPCKDTPRSDVSRGTEWSPGLAPRASPPGGSALPLGRLLKGTGFEHASKWLESMSRHQGQFATNGDFWRLTNVSLGTGVWAAWQYHLSMENAGVAYYFRREQCPSSQMPVSLHYIKPNLSYMVEVFRSCHVVHSQVMTGAALAGMIVSIPEAPGSVLLQYAANDATDTT